MADENAITGAVEIELFRGGELIKTVTITRKLTGRDEKIENF